jgi:acetyl esterase/lipase
MPAAIVAFSPGLDATRAGESMVTKADADPLIDRAAIDHMSGFYVAGQDRRNPLLSPAVTADLAGLPPVLVQVGTNEMLLDDARRLALRASDAEVDVILDITAKVPHVFQSFTGALDEAGQALDRAALFLRQHVRG